MKILVNRFIPFLGYVAMAFYGMIFVRKQYLYLFNLNKKRVINHESIHVALMKDFCPWLPIGGTIFYICYFIEWLWKLCMFGFDARKAYRELGFEIEAKENETNMEYLSTRKKWAWIPKGKKLKYTIWFTLIFVIFVVGIVLGICGI